MIRRPPRSTPLYSSAASDVYKRQLLPDLHGNTAGALNSTASAVTDAFAYDAYGNTVAAVTSALPTPWRYQGRILESAAGTPDLYDFGARSYSPTIGTFTSLDSLHGSAGNPALLNGYLYANATRPRSWIRTDMRPAVVVAGTVVGPEETVVAGGLCLAIVAAVWE